MDGGREGGRDGRRDGRREERGEWVSVKWMCGRRLDPT